VSPGDEPLLEPFLAVLTVRRVSFALAGVADYVARELVHRPDGGMSFRLPGFPPLAVALPGRHNVGNALAAVACAHSLGFTPEECARGLAAARVPGGRSEVARWGGVTLLLDHYNANPGSMEAGLETLRGWPGGGRRYAALGDMLELGAATDDAHAELGRRAAALDGAFLWGEHMAHAERAAQAAGAGGRVRRFATRRALGESLAAVLRPGDLVLVKGSRGSAMEEVVEVLRAALGGGAHEEAGHAPARAGEGG